MVLLALGPIGAVVIFTLTVMAALIDEDLLVAGYTASVSVTIAM